jgi:hypothetical protein
LDRLTAALVRLAVSPVAGFRPCLLRLRHIDGRSSVLLFCRNKPSSPNLRLSDDVLDVNDPDFWLCLVLTLSPHTGSLKFTIPIPNPCGKPCGSSKIRSQSSTSRSSRLI